MAEHRWKLACELHPDESQGQLAGLLAGLVDEGWDLFEQIDPVGFFGWTLRYGDAGVGVAVPQPGGPAEIVVRSADRELGERVVNALVADGPLTGAEAVHFEVPETTDA